MKTNFKSYEEFYQELRSFTRRYREQSGILYPPQFDKFEELWEEIVDAYERYDTLDDEEFMSLGKIASKFGVMV